jgi:hypothetical protein
LTVGAEFAVDLQATQLQSLNKVLSRRESVVEVEEEDAANIAKKPRSFTALHPPKDG